MASKHEIVRLTRTNKLRAKRRTCKKVRIKVTNITRKPHAFKCNIRMKHGRRMYIIEKKQNIGDGTETVDFVTLPKELK